MTPEQINTLKDLAGVMGRALDQGVTPTIHATRQRIAAVITAHTLQK